MILHGSTLISEDLLEEEFACNLSSCKGICCVEGDSGAPMTETEKGQIAEGMEKILPYMDTWAREKYSAEGFWEEDRDGDIVTKCDNGKDCIFVKKDRLGVFKCSIEAAYRAGEIGFNKPLSCHLYPVRIKELGDFTALNYDRWDICSPACELGAARKIKVYEFVREALVRKFGTKWFEELANIASNWDPDMKKDLS